MEAQSSPLPDASTSNSNIDIKAQPAVLKWRTSDGEDHCLSQLALDLHYDVRSSRAFFILRAAVSLKSCPRSRNTPVFLFIHPERIRTLVLDDSPDAAEARTLGPETFRLHFELSRSPALVVPKESLTPRNLTSGNILDSLQAVVKQTTFSIYAKAPSRLLPRQRLLALCGAVSRSEITSIVAHSNTSSLYAGAGGNIIEGDSIIGSEITAIIEERESAVEPPVEDPPAYDEAAPGLPPPGPSGHKRQRPSTPEPGSEPLERLDRKFLEDICAHMIENKLGQLRRDISKQLQDMENRIIDYVDEQMTHQRQEITDDVHLQIEDEHYGLKLDLQNYVRDEIEDGEGRILEHLSTASFSLQLNQ